MSPFLLRVPSTLLAGIGFDSGKVGIWCFLTKSWSKKHPCAPQSIRAFVSTVLSPTLAEMGIHIDNSRVSARSTEEIEILARVDVDSTRLFKNPDPPCFSCISLFLHLAILPSWL